MACDSRCGGFREGRCQRVTTAILFACPTSATQLSRASELLLLTAWCRLTVGFSRSAFLPSASLVSSTFLPFASFSLFLFLPLAHLPLVAWPPSLPREPPSPRRSVSHRFLSCVLLSIPSFFTTSLPPFLLSSLARLPLGACYLTNSPVTPGVVPSACAVASGVPGCWEGSMLGSCSKEIEGDRDRGKGGL